MALRTLILDHCHESLLVEHKEVDNHELCKLTSTLESRGDTSKLDHQIKSEVIVAIESMLCRDATRARIDENSLKYLRRTLETQSFSRLPRVRTIAKELLHKLKHPEMLAPKYATDFPLENQGMVYSQSAPLFPSIAAQRIEKKDRIYIGPPRQSDQAPPLTNPYSLANSNELPKLESSEVGVNDSMGKIFNFDKVPQGTENAPVLSSLQMPAFVPPADKDPQIPALPLVLSLPQDHASLQEPQPLQHSNLSFAGQQQPVTTDLRVSDSQANSVASNGGLIVEDYPRQSSPQLRLKRDAMKLLKLPQEESRMRRPSPEQEHGEIPELKRGMFVIEDPLLRMTQGKGWGPNVRAKNFLKKHSGKNLYEMGEDNGTSDKLLERREKRSKQRHELNYLIGKSKNDSKSRSPAKFSLLDEAGEKRRKHRLLLISKGLDPDDPQADEKLRAILEKVEEEERNPIIKRRPSGDRSQKETEGQCCPRERALRGRVV